MTNPEPLTEVEIAEVEARANAATEGPWEWLDAYMMRHENPDVKVPFNARQRMADRLFTSNARTDIPRLIAHIRALEIACTHKYRQGALDAAGKLPCGHPVACIGDDQYPCCICTYQSENEALRAALKECVEAYYCDPAIKSNDGRMARALTAAKEAIGNG